MIQARSSLSGESSKRSFSVHSQLCGMPFQPSITSSNTPATAAPGCRRSPRPTRPDGSGRPLPSASSVEPTALPERQMARALTVTDGPRVPSAPSARAATA